MLYKRVCSEYHIFALHLPQLGLCTLKGACSLPLCHKALSASVQQCYVYCSKTLEVRFAPCGAANSTSAQELSSTPRVHDQ